MKIVNLDTKDYFLLDDEIIQTDGKFRFIDCGEIVLEIVEESDFRGRHINCIGAVKNGHIISIFDNLVKDPNELMLIGKKYVEIKYYLTQGGSNGQV